ncbi:hypothetical protein PR202_gb08459 [Eleusine coracana subsp. coracana]|uniref:WRKY domain-containing protein n=1 Tax=Eleusine coracana subsp. coracana TaxID=191504 RepID=A0AAV5ECA4_ELECO|nr:hypothetical protein PR202_gb08459 [Eleusine coracana subsp. coracana]
MITMEEDLAGRSVPGGDTREAGPEPDQLMMTEPRLRAAMVSMLNRRTGHARFRRGPVLAQQEPPSSDQPSGGAAAIKQCKGISLSASTSAASSSSLPSTTLTSLTAGGEGSVSGGYRALFLPAAKASSGRVETSVGGHDRARSENDAAAGKAHGGGCHCSKKRKSRVKSVIRVPAISSRNADIPTDDYSWRKYGQKPIKGSPYPR